MKKVKIVNKQKAIDHFGTRRQIEIENVFTKINNELKLDVEYLPFTYVNLAHTKVVDNMRLRDQRDPNPRREIASRLSLLKTAAPRRLRNRKIPST